jgi:GntR family transcriptional regulator
MEKKPVIGLDDVAAVHNSPGSLYHSLGHIIRAKIEAGEWEIGQKIPAEREMMEIFSISRATVRQGIDNLVKEGILYRVQGKGTFVSPPKIEHGVLRILDFCDLVDQTGLKSSSQMIAKQEIIPPLNVQNTLRLGKGEKVLWIRRLILVNNIQVMIESSYLPTNQFPEMEDQYRGVNAPHVHVFKHYGKKIFRVKEMFEPVVLEGAEAKILGTEGGYPALWVEISAFDENDSPFEFLTALIRGDRVRTYYEMVVDRC